MKSYIIEVNQKLVSLQTQLGAVMQTQLDELTESLNVVIDLLYMTCRLFVRLNNALLICVQDLVKFVPIVLNP